jgi:2'-5' RNA ligase
MTLVFLGYLPEKQIEHTAVTAFGALDGLAPPLLAMRGFRAVPPRDPRLFAVDLADEGDRAAAIQAAAVRVLSEARLHKPEKRPFWPHVTVARVKRSERRVPPLEAPVPPADPFVAPVVTLYRSHLSPRGARYEPLERLTLGS